VERPERHPSCSVIGSITFSLCVSEAGSYDRTYGSLGAVIVLLLGFYMTAYVILIGAELNAEMARQAVEAVRPLSKQ
jgi:membrane protein